MGEVYRAHDAKLNRDVAIKVLPGRISQDQERLERFEQEAQATATLNHPNIVGVFDVGNEDGVTYLVSELLDGEDLRGRLNHGPIPQRTTLEYAQHIAAGLAAAHEKGIVHRDLKPENIFVTTDGRVKILDFGLAKLRPVENVGTDSDVVTLRQKTDPGTILGTVGYMSPEQVRGLEADHRSDIFSFGAILYEMLTGERAFRRETMPETMTAILNDEPRDFSETRTTINPQLEKVIRRCLEKNPQRRFQSAHDLGFALESLSIPSGFSGSTKSPAASQTVSRPRFLDLERVGWIAATVALIAVAMALMYLYLRGKPAGQGIALTRQFTLTQPKEGPLAPSSVAILFSPNGTHLVSTNSVSGKIRLFARQLSESDSHAIDGTDGAIDTFFSPDGQWLAFFANGELKKVRLTGGVAESLCKAQNARGGVWADDGSIIFTPGTDAPLYRVGSSGGPVKALSTLDTSARERSHRWPATLPDGKGIVFSVAYETGNPLDDASIAVLDPANGKHKIIIRGGAFPRYVSTGHLVYARRRSLLAVPFDLKRLEVTGPPMAVLANIMTNPANGRAQFSFSNSGDLVYVEGEADDTTNIREPLVWVDRHGNEQALTKAGMRYSKPRLGPDGRTLFIQIDDPEASVWSYSIERGTLTRLTTSGVSYGPVPSPDGTRVAYEATRNGVAGILIVRIDGSDEQRLTSTKRLHLASSWSPDGKTLAVTSSAESGFLEVLLVDVDGDHTARTFIQGPFNAGGARFSPDAKWIAYVSDESGRNEVYVRPYEQSGARIQISTDGGSQPVWSRNGRELFFRNDDQLMVVSVNPGSKLTVGKPVVLFQRHTRESAAGSAYGLTADYDVSLEGQRFVFPKYDPNVSSAPKLKVILNWFDAITQLSGSAR